MSRIAWPAALNDPPQNAWCNSSKRSAPLPSWSFNTIRISSPPQRPAHSSPRSTGLYHPADRAQHVVVAEVAVFLVHPLELIDIQQRHYQFLARFSGGEALGQSSFDFAAIEQPGQAVMAVAAANAMGDAERTADPSACSRMRGRSGRRARLRKALEAFPEDVALMEQQVTLASAAGDFDEAARRPATRRARCPDSGPIPHHGQPPKHAWAPGCRRRAATSGEQHRRAAVASGGFQCGRCSSGAFREPGCAGVRLRIRHGPAQLRCGPDRPMRSANMTMQGLIGAVACGFEGIGDPEHTRIEYRIAASGERK